MKNWWTLSVEQVCDFFKVDNITGLDQNEAQNRIQKYGFNILPETSGISPIKIFIRQFNNFIILILIFALIISAILGQIVDSLVIGVIILLNAIIGFFQEYYAEKSIAALAKMVKPTAKVIRNGIMQQINSKFIVPGDLVVIDSGDNVPADGRIIKNFGLAIQEASLTGESISVYKTTAIINDKNLAIGDRKNMVFMGTTVEYGRGYFIVTETGIKTELGKIATTLEKITPEKTPLEKQLKQLGYVLVSFCILISLIIFITGIIYSIDLSTILILSLSVAVASIPEGLPTIITVALAVGVKRMAKKHAIIRKLPAIETLGCVTVICTDKTGTLTKNEMVVCQFWIDGQFISVTGIDYIPEGEFKIKDKIINPKDLPELFKALEIGVLCNSANLFKKHNKWQISGSPTEASLLVAGAKAGIFKQDLDKKYPIIIEFPFDQTTKLMGVVREIDNKKILFVKGAVDKLINLTAGLSQSKKAEILKANSELASKALRILALAYKEIDNINFDKISFDNFTFVGLAAMMDPPRIEAKISLDKAKTAGIKVVMITGDHKETGIAIAKEVGILQPGDLAVDGVELKQMTDHALINNLKKIKVYSRVDSSDKERIVRAFKSVDEVVAMTGDGVNDALAIKVADVGIAMGITGTDVTKETSDMLIVDDNFKSIIAAIEEGRGTYDNIIKFINYLVSSNIAELLVILPAFMMGLMFKQNGFFIPLEAVHILWLNLITDGLPAIALAFDPVSKRVMEKPPRDIKKAIITKEFAYRLITIAIIIASGALVAGYLGVLFNNQISQTMTLTTLIVLAFVRMHVIRKQYHQSFFTNKLLVFSLIISLLLQILIMYTPILNQIFKVEPLKLFHWAAILLIALIVWVIVIIIERFVFKKTDIAT